MCLQLHGGPALKTCALLLKCLLTLSILTSSVTGVSWVTQPSDLSVIVNGNASLPCEVQGGNNLTMVWNKGTVPIFINGQKASGVSERYSIQGQNSLFIQNVTIDDDSFFTCTIFQFEHVQVKLTVLLPPGPPTITSNVSSSLFIENTVILLTCSSSGGKPPPTMLWLKNGQSINSANYIPSENGTSSSQITITLQRSDHSANYSCKVFNQANQNAPHVRSQILNVQYAPSISFEPNYSPYRVKIKSPINLRCKVDSNPSYQSIEWRKDGNLLPYSENVTINSIEKSHSGNYTCTARNTIRGQMYTATAWVVIDVIYAPIITTTRLIEANISTEVNMSCKVDSNPPPSQILWQKLGQDVINANGPNFVFFAQKRYDGNYTCTAFSRLQPSGMDPEDITSKGTTTVKVRYAPGQAFINPVTPILVGQTLTLTCTLSDQGYPYPTFQWRKIGSSQLLPSTGPMYTISSAKLTDNGKYSCLPTNMMGNGNPATVQVVVNSPPQIILSSPPGDVWTIPITQSNLYLEHKVQGRPMPIIQWYKDGEPLSALSSFYAVETTNVQDQYMYNVTTRVNFIGSGREKNRLLISDLGNYTCRVLSPETGNPVAKSTFLSVEFAPKVTASVRVAANVGEAATLTCRSQSNPAPVYHWFRGGQRLTNSSRMLIGQQSVSGVVMYEGYLQIHPTRSSDFLDYTCEVNNKHGQVRQTVKLSLKDKPEPPTDLAATDKTWESVQLEWNPGFNGGYPQTFHVLMQSVYGEKSVEVYPNGTSTFNVTRLMPLTSYTFYVYGKNKLGQGHNSEGFTAKTEMLIFPALKEVPEYHVEGKELKVPNNLNQSYCLRIELSTNNRKKWTVIESCVTAVEGTVSLAHQGATDVNVSVCLVYRPEVCGEPVMSKINEKSTPDLTETQVIIIGCVCALILITLLIVLICIIWRRKQRNKQYNNDPHSPRTVQQGNGALPNQKPRNFDTQDINGGGDNYYGDNKGDLSFNGSPRTPTKDPQQFIGVPEEHTKEGGSFGSGNESGYSTPDKAKPKKEKRFGKSIFPFNLLSKQDKNLQTNPDMVPYFHNPPGHTCGLPCCNKDLQVHLNKTKKPHRSCIGIQEYDVLAQNFTFNGKLKRMPGLQSGFFSVQEVKDSERAKIPEFRSVPEKLFSVKEVKNFNFMKGREITLPEVSKMHSTEKLYLEDFNFGETDDFQNIEIFVDDNDDKRHNDVDKVDYYLSSSSSRSSKGVPYDPKQIENKKLYPWSMSKDLVDPSQKDDSSVSNYYSSGSNYYETLQDPEEEEEKLHEDIDEVPEKCDSGIDDDSNTPDVDSSGRARKIPSTLPPVPPKLPVQTRFNHPPLSKSSKFKSKTLPMGDISDTDSSTRTQYNTYNSVCSISNFANQMSKEAYERFLSLDRDTLTQKPVRRDIRELSYTGDDMPITAKNMELAATKAKLAQSVKNKISESLSKGTNSVSKGSNSLSKGSNFSRKNDQIDEDKAAVTSVKDMQEDSYMDIYDDDSGGSVNQAFKSIKLVDGKILGSRYSLDRVNSFSDQLHDRFLHLCDKEDGLAQNEDEKKVMVLLKRRLRDVDKQEDSPSGESFNENPVTLIL
ncbi:hypothetical protein ACF0H5_011957 [Mactra antiquata]